MAKITIMLDALKAVNSLRQPRKQRYYLNGVFLDTTTPKIYHPRRNDGHRSRPLSQR